MSPAKHAAAIVAATRTLDRALKAAEGELSAGQARIIVASMQDVMDDLHHELDDLLEVTK